jgi:hypothetical protein
MEGFRVFGAGLCVFATDSNEYLQPAWAATASTKIFGGRSDEAGRRASLPTRQDTIDRKASWEGHQLHQNIINTCHQRPDLDLIVSIDGGA